MSFLLERNEGRHQKALQNMCNMPTTQTRECEIREEIFRPSLQPMDFICMDLIGEFHPQQVMDTIML